MAESKLLKEQTEKTTLPYVRQIGAILAQLSEKSEKIAELIEQDLAVPEMSLEACGAKLLDYARKNQTNNYWGCAFELSDDNPIFCIISDFYEIPSAWVFQPPLEDGCSAGGGAIDLMDLL